MELLDIVRREPVPEPWALGEKIPWNDPDFSARMLREHLSQAHDAASRRTAKIERHVAWLHQHVLGGRPGRILDLGCGPGLYAQQLATLGHRCVGIDFGPASIAYAREQAEETGASCRYVQGDIRTTDYGGPYDLVMLIFGEFNVFRLEDAARILDKAFAALTPGGALVLEPHTFETVEAEGRASPDWYSAESRLFSERPHLYLHESFWDAERRATTHRYFVVDAQTGAVSRHASSMQAYTDQQYEELLRKHGFANVSLWPSLTGEVDPDMSGLLAIEARKPDGAADIQKDLS